jgi:hypothetical protein
MMHSSDNGYTLNAALHKDGHYRWLNTNQKLNYTNWGQSEPITTDYIRVSSYTGKWMGKRETDHPTTICQRSNSFLTTHFTHNPQQYLILPYKKTYQ